MATAPPMLLHFSGLSKGSRKGLLQQATLVRKPAGSLTFNTFCRFWAAGLPSAHADREDFFLHFPQLIASEQVGPKAGMLYRIKTS